MTDFEGYSETHLIYLLKQAVSIAGDTFEDNESYALFNYLDYLEDMI